MRNTPELGTGQPQKRPAMTSADSVGPRRLLGLAIRATSKGASPLVMLEPSSLTTPELRVPRYEVSIPVSGEECQLLVEAVAPRTFVGLKDMDQHTTRNEAGPTGRLQGRRPKNCFLPLRLEPLAWSLHCSASTVDAEWCGSGQGGPGLRWMEW